MTAAGDSSRNPVREHLRPLGIRKETGGVAITGQGATTLPAKGIAKNCLILASLTASGIRTQFTGTKFLISGIEAISVYFLLYLFWSVYDVMMSRLSGLSSSVSIDDVDHFAQSRGIAAIEV